jgi:hypothetical protein
MLITVNGHFNPPSTILAQYTICFPIQPRIIFIQHIGKSPLMVVREHIRT